MSQRSIIPVGHGYKKTVVSYSGKVYCVTVPSGIILTRRLGKVCVAGNCIHALLGVCLVEHIRQERPEWFNEAFYGKLYRACHKAYQAEARIIDWIFEAGELSFLPRDLVLEFTRRRFNDSLALLGGEPQFDVNDRLLEAVSWFDDEIYADTSVDFFHKRPVTYAKKARSIRAEDLFHHATIKEVDINE